MDVVLHIGAHRCASTTLQQFLQRNEMSLSRAGVEAWTPDRTRTGLFAGLLQRPTDKPAQAEQRAKRSSGVIRIEADRLERSGTRTLVVTEENLIGAVRDNLRAGGLYTSATGRLEALLPALGDKVTRVALCIRSYDSYWASCVSYGVAQGHRVPSADKLAKIVANPRRWRHLVADVAHVFPDAEIVVWPFERFSGQPETQLAIMTRGVHLPASLRGARDWQNPSPRLEKLRRILKLRGDGEMAARLPEGDGRWTPFDAIQSATLRNAYREDLAWFAAGAGGMARWIETAPESRIETTEDLQSVPEAHYEVSGFAAPPQTWVPPEGGQDIGKQRHMVQTGHG